MRFSQFFPVILLIAGGVFKPVLGAESDDPILGQWKWFTKSTKVFHADGTLTPKEKGGTWTRLNPGEWPARYRINWRDKKKVDLLVLERKDNHLSGKSLTGAHVSADRLSHGDPDQVAKVVGAPSVPAAPPAWNPSSLTEPLGPYLRNLPNLLSLHRTGDQNTQTFLTQATGNLIVVRQEIVVKSEKATAQNAPAFNAALRTCDLLAAALAERSKVVGDLQASAAVVNDGKLEEPARKDNLTQGVHGDGLAKAVGSIVERKRERAANAKAAERAKASDHALTVMAENNWNQRSTQWTTQIAAACGEIR